MNDAAGPAKEEKREPVGEAKKDPVEEAKKAGIRQSRILFVGIAVASLAVILLLLATGTPRPVQAALFAAALSTLGLALVRLADGFEEPRSVDRRRRDQGYAKFWLASFAVAFGGLVLADLLGRVPAELETPWLHGAKPGPAADPRCAVLANPKAPDQQLAAAVRAGCR